MAHRPHAVLRLGHMPTPRPAVPSRRPRGIDESGTRACALRTIRRTPGKCVSNNGAADNHAAEQRQFLVAQDAGSTFGLDTELTADETYRLHIAVQHASRREVLMPFHRRAAELFVETMSAQERRGSGDVFDRASPRYVVWEEGMQPPNPLGQQEDWVDDLWFREERDGDAAAQVTTAAGEGDEPTTAHMYGEQAGDLGELLESDSEDAVVDGGQAEHESAQPTGLGSSAGEPIEIDEGEDGERVERGIPRDRRWENPRHW